MSIQMLGQVRYAPSRDIVYLLPSTLTTITNRIYDRANPQLADYLDDHGVTQDMLVEGLVAYSTFIGLAESAPELSMAEASKQSSWDDLRRDVQVAVLYHVGVVMTGSFFLGAREAAGPEGSKVPTLAMFMDSARELADYWQMPRWKKWFYKWKPRLPKVGF